MKQMTVVRLTASARLHTYKLHCTFEYSMNKGRNNFEQSFFRQAQGLLFPAQLQGGPEQVREFPRDGGAQLLVGA